MILLAIALSLAPAPAKTSDKLPPANPLPPPSEDVSAVMTPVNGLFAGIAAGDPAAVARTLTDDAGAIIASETPDGGRSLTRLPHDALLARFKATPGSRQEKLYDPAIEVDGDVAMVWGRYDFFIDGKVHHCGYDHFALVRESGAWKIAHASWSSRTTGCGAAQ